MDDGIFVKSWHFLLTDGCISQDLPYFKSDFDQISFNLFKVNLAMLLATNQIKFHVARYSILAQIMCVRFSRSLIRSHAGHCHVCHALDE